MKIAKHINHLRLGLSCAKFRFSKLTESKQRKDEVRVYAHKNVHVLLKVLLVRHLCGETIYWRFLVLSKFNNKKQIHQTFTVRNVLESKKNKYKKNYVMFLTTS